MGTNPDTGAPEVLRAADPNAPFAGLVFKIVTDPFVGRLAYVRVYSGTLVSGQPRSTTPTAGRSANASGAWCDARRQARGVKVVQAGDIAAIVGLKDTLYGRDTVRSQERDYP
jgi:elongation factor G